MAPFACDGELLGVGSWSSGNLSTDWLTRCAALSEFEHPNTIHLAQPYNDFSVCSTVVDGVALATFRYRDTIAASAVISNGQDRLTETDIFRMFLDSIRNVELVRLAETNRGFDTLWSIQERPLMVVVPWPIHEMTDSDSEVVTQFSIHFAASLIAKWNLG